MVSKESSKILIVEDETLVAQDIKRRLLKMGYENLLVSVTGDDAIERARAFQPDLILMDIILSKGNLNGIETVKKIQEFLDVPIVYLTASSDVDTMKEAKETNPSGFILKPFQTRELQIAIELILYKNDSDKEIQKKERLVRSTLKNIGEGIIAIDNTETVYFMNTVALTLTGWKEEEALGRSIQEILNLAPVMKLGNVETSHFASDSYVIPTEGFLLSKNGERTSVEIVNRAILGNESEAIGKVLIIREKAE
ncbi:GGDEF domain-containing response regulator [Leptospira barantonii]|uniref:GGDEF domain-containing response regulator n=1 Tax=Leptospira barantonii TaxID=2023184 RepID=A0A5F2B688_9LEPT|nr:response regulator [Leptospira barantonii]TGM01143.1 GGDEF domain-containing response regulator [Leptospira barantonii]